MYLSVIPRELLMMLSISRLKVHAGSRIMPCLKVKRSCDKVAVLYSVHYAS